MVGDLVDADAADGGRREIVRDVSVERAGKIGQERRLKPEILDDVAQLVEIAGREMAAGQHIDAVRIAARRVAGVSTSTSTIRATVFSQPSWNASLKSGVET